MQTMAPPEVALQERFARIDERFDRVNERLVELDRRITETSVATNKRLDGIETEVGELRQGMKTLHEGVHRATIALWVSSAGVIAAILAKGS
jgi:hypothetical protein